jgi:hypothetical protein
MLLALRSASSYGSRFAVAASGRVKMPLDREAPRLPKMQKA